MKFEVFCDEVFPDLLTSSKPKAQYLMIGSLWLPADLRKELKDQIHGLRIKHSVWGEIKWTKVSPAKVEFYQELVAMFVDFGDNIRFRCIAVDQKQVNLDLHSGDQELGFYKFYYQVIHHWILDYNSYSVFCDLKANRDPKRLTELRKVLKNANLNAEICSVQALPSKDVALIQLSDLLLGAASSRINGTLNTGTAKEAVVKELEQKLGRSKLLPTFASEQKFNIFKINLGGGW